MSDPDALKSIFEDPSDLEMVTSLIPSILKLQQSINHSSITWHGSAHHGTSLDLLLQYPLWFLSLLCYTNDIAITPIIPTDHYFLHSTTPMTIALGERHHRSQEGNTLYQGRRTG